MKGNSQFDVYAAFYDLLYKDKDYRGESVYIDQLITKYVKRDRSKLSLLDLACGTAKHLLELGTMGYSSLSGSDISKAMIEVARKNVEARGQKIKLYDFSFQQADQIKENFDVILSMFSALNYLTTYADQSKTLSNIHGLLNPGGIFIFDYWNGCAVTEIYSPVKALRKKQDNAEIQRISETTLNLIEQSATVKFICQYFKNDERIADFEETHHLHYYYFSEMKNLLESHDFEIIHIGPFMHMDKKLSPQDWNISIVARKKSQK